MVLKKRDDLFMAIFTEMIKPFVDRLHWKIINDGNMVSFVNKKGACFHDCNSVKVEHLAIRISNLIGCDPATSIDFVINRLPVRFKNRTRWFV